MGRILSAVQALIEEIDKLEGDDKIEALNAAKTALHEASPFCNEPVDLVIWVKPENVVANDYNPNSVAPPEMLLLEESVTLDGYTQPIVSFDDGQNLTVVDGFHRSRVGRESDGVKERTGGYLLSRRSTKTERG